MDLSFKTNALDKTQFIEFRKEREPEEENIEREEPPREWANDQNSYNV